MKTPTLIALTIFITSCFGVEENQSRMGIFDKLSGKNNQKIEKTSEMLDEEKFWDIVNRSAQLSASEEHQISFLVNEIKKLTPKEMIGFRLRTDKLLYDTYSSEMWCAGYIMNGGCSDDGFEYFRNWVISCGEDVYKEAKENPDNLISQYKEGRYEYELEDFWYVALTAFNNKTGKELYDYIDYDEFKTREGNYPIFEFNWEEGKPETMRALCPNLFEKMWN